MLSPSTRYRRRPKNDASRQSRLKRIKAAEAFGESRMTMLSLALVPFCSILRRSKLGSLERSRHVFSQPGS